MVENPKGLFNIGFLNDKRRGKHQTVPIISRMQADDPFGQKFIQRPARGFTSRLLGLAVQNQFNAEIEAETASRIEGLSRIGVRRLVGDFGMSFGVNLIPLIDVWISQNAETK